MSALGNGLVQLFKAGRKRIGKAVDNYLLDAEARKAISDEVLNRYKPKIDLARAAESRRAANIKDLGDKVTQSRKDLADAQKAWQDKFNAELAGAKNQRQTDINDYNTKLQGYQSALDNANTARQDIVDKLSDLEKLNDPYRTIYTDVKSGDRYVLHPITNSYINITKLYPTLSDKEARNLSNRIQNYETRLWDKKSGNVINAFDESNKNTYGNGKYSEFDKYLSIREGQNAALLRDLKDADNKVNLADANLQTWTNQGRPKDWDDTIDLKPFKDSFKNNNGAKPNEYSFNGQNYKSASDLNKAYQDALKHETALQNSASKSASKYISDQKAVIAQRIQDAKDAKKAKLALGALGVGAGAGALYAGARAIYGGDDTDNTDNTDNINNIDNTDNTDYGKSDPRFNVEKEGQAILKDRQQSDPDINVDTDFDPDKAAAVLASGAYDTGVEDGNSVRSSADLVNNIAASTGGHTMEDRLYELIKAMQDPYKADAVANYIYSRHGDDPEVQRLGWRGWLNKYYGDSLRSIMNRDPSGYNGMHVSGGL